MKKVIFEWWELIYMSEFIAEKILEINLKYQQKLKIYTNCSLTLFINIISIVHARETKTRTLAHQTIYSGRSIVLFS